MFTLLHAASTVLAGYYLFNIATIRATCSTKHACIHHLLLACSCVCKQSTVELDTASGYTVQQRSNRDCLCEQQETKNLYKSTISSPHALKTITSIRKSPAAFLSSLQCSILLFLLTLNWSVTLIHGQDDALPARCLNNPSERCVFAFATQYRYSAGSKQCERILCAPLTTDEDSFNRFSSRDQCEDTCLSSKLIFCII